MAVELFTDYALTTVASGGTTAPSSGSTETWTVASSSGFPAAATGLTQFHVADPQLPTENILVTNVSGTTWSVTRGAESSTPVAHAAGFTVKQVVTAGWLTSALAGVLQPSGDTSGTLDTAYLNAAVAQLGSQGGTVRVAPGAFYWTCGGIVIAQAQVYIQGSGRWATIANAVGTGDVIRMYNPHYGGGGLWGGGVKDLTIDGTSAGAGSTGLHIGDGEQYELNVAVQNFSGTGSIGLHLDNSIWWTEKTHGTVFARNCTEHVVFDVTSPAATVAAGSNGGTISGIATWGGGFGGNGVLDVASTAGFGTSGTVNVAASGATTAVVTYTGKTSGTLTGCAYVSGSPSGTVSTGGAVTLVSSTNSFGYLDLVCYLYSQPNQDGVVAQNGALPYHGSLVIKGNFQGSASAVSNAVLRLTGTIPAGHPGAGNGSAIARCHLDIQAEVGSFAHQPRTIFFGSAAANTIQGCYGIMDFTQGAGTFANSNVDISASAFSMSFTGLLIGDPLLNPGDTFEQPVTIGTQMLSQSFMSGANGNTFLDWGDFFAATLSASITINLNPSSEGVIPAPQRKTIILTQAASGGPYTVTWPHPGSPTISNPTVLWAGGTAPVMSTGAGAVDVYDLETLDGTTWYGRATQNVS